MESVHVTVSLSLQLAGQSSAQMPVREVKQFHFLKWPDHGVPNYATALLHFRKRVHNYHPEKRGPMVVHCRSVGGLSGVLALSLPVQIPVPLA